MSVSLPPDLEEFVRQELAGGGYSSEDEILLEGLRLLQERKKRLQCIQSDIQIGLDQLDRGEGVPLDMDVVKEKVTQRLNEEAQEI